MKDLGVRTDSLTWGHNRISRLIKFYHFTRLSRADVDIHQLRGLYPGRAQSTMDGGSH